MSLVEEVAFHKLDQRLAGLLLRVREPGTPIPLTHQEVAENLGCSREIVSRILESFKIRGMVELGRKRIVVTGEKELRRTADATL